MAIIRLTDIVATMKDKWTYGDKFFGYTEEFNGKIILLRFISQTYTIELTKQTKA